MEICLDYLNYANGTPQYCYRQLEALVKVRLPLHGLILVPEALKLWRNNLIHPFTEVSSLHHCTSSTRLCVPHSRPCNHNPHEAIVQRRQHQSPTDGVDSGHTHILFQCHLVADDPKFTLVMHLASLLNMEHLAVSRHSSVLSHKPTRIASAVSSSQGRRSSTRQVPPKPQPSLRIQENSELRRRSAEESPAKLRQLGSEQLLQFEREGHLCVRGLFDGEEMGALGVAVSGAANKEKLNAYRHRVAVLCPGVDPFSLNSVAEAEAVIRQQGTDELGFLQSFNLHQKSQVVRQWASHPRMVAMVADLLGAKKVRLYQDCLFQKMSGFGVTNWHSDLNMVPLDTNSFLTVWIPLRSLDKTDSSLHFASGSHRDFALAYWQNNQGMANLESRGYPVADYPCMTLGDVSIHHGWTLHWAPGQPGAGPARAAWTVSYFADGARILESRHARRKLQEEDGWSYRAWRKDLKEGQVARHPFLPLVYPLGVDNAKQHKGVPRKR